jgi:peptidoglycan hydrolase CwlO-like protein
MSEKQDTMGLLELLRSSWFLIVFVGSLIYWVAKQDSSLSNIQKSESRITSLENRTTILESGIGQLQLKIDRIKEDLNLIKSAVIK